MREAPPPRTHPFLVRRPPGDDRYFRTLHEARTRILGDLDDVKVLYTRLGDRAAVQVVEQLKDQVRRVASRGEGVVEGVIDPELGVKYYAELVLRREF